MVKGYLLTLFLLAINGISTQAEAAQVVNDPTRPALTTAKMVNTGPIEIKKPQLTAIFIKQGVNRAIINDKLYRLGDFFGDKKIIKIEINGVTLMNNKDVSQLTLINPFKKLKKH